MPRESQGMLSYLTFSFPKEQASGILSTPTVSRNIELKLSTSFVAYFFNNCFTPICSLGAFGVVYYNIVLARVHARFCNSSLLSHERLSSSYRCTRSIKCTLATYARQNPASSLFTEHYAMCIRLTHVILTKA